MQKLLKNRVRPYYIYQCDLVPGADHFRTPVAKGIEIMESLRGHTSGLAVPTYVIDAPEGGGKVPILPNYLLSMSDSRVVVRNYEGFVTTYAQPTDYRPHNPATCTYCQAHRDEEKQDGVAGLLGGRGLVIAPEGWRAVHERSTVPQVLTSEVFLSASRDNADQSDPATNVDMHELVAEWPKAGIAHSQKLSGF